jgi:hypothetical protein
MLLPCVRVAEGDGFSIVTADYPGIVGSILPEAALTMRDIDDLRGPFAGWPRDHGD